MYIGGSENSSTPKTSILIRFSIINHPFWGTPIFGNIHICLSNLTFQMFGSIEAILQAENVAASPPAYSQGSCESLDSLHL